LLACTSHIEEINRHTYTCTCRTNCEFGRSKATKYCIQKAAFLRTATDKYKLYIAEDSFPTPQHFKNTFDNRIFLICTERSDQTHNTARRLSDTQNLIEKWSGYVARTAVFSCAVEVIPVRLLDTANHKCSSSCCLLRQVDCVAGVDVTFSKGARQKLKFRQFWTAAHVRLMWTDQATFWHSVRYKGETSVDGRNFFPHILDLAIVFAHFLQKSTSRKFLSISYDRTKRKFCPRIPTKKFIEKLGAVQLGRNLGESVCPVRSHRQ
jgi:hypothetical protein